MATSTLTYYSCEITPQRNALVDQIETYLASVSHTSVSNFQYIKPTLDTYIKLDLPQYLSSSQDINYVKIYQDNRNWYYFVTKITPIAQNTVKLDLHMDTINTFQYEIMNGITDKSTIIREHRDRFIDTGATPGQTANLIRKVDDVAEGIDVVRGIGLGKNTKHPYYNSSSVSNSGTIKDVAHFNDKKWYLCYKSDQKLGYTNTITSGTTAESYSNSTIALTIRSDEELPVKLGTVASSSEAKTLTTTGGKLLDDIGLHYTGVFECFLGDNSIGSHTISVDGVNHTFTNGLSPKIKYGNTEYALDGSGTSPNGSAYNSISFVYRHEFVGIVWDVRYGFRFRQNGTEVDWVGISSSTDVSLTFSNIKYLRCKNSDDGSMSLPYVANVINSPYIDLGLNAPSTTDTVTYSIPALDYALRINPRVGAIIEFPYCPCEVLYNTSHAVYDFDNVYSSTNTSNWLLSPEDEEVFQSGNLKRKLTNVLPFSNIMTRLLPASTSASKLIMSRDTYASAYGTLESKLFNSAFFTYRLRYDTFYRDFAMERMSNASAGYGNITMYASASQSSKIAFVVDWSPVATYSVLDDKENIIYCNRNLEVPLFSSAYLNYMNTGYNYDKKANDLAASNRWTQTAITGVSGAAQAVAGAVGGNPFAITGAISTLTSATSSIFNNITATQQADNSMLKKQAELAEQPTSLKGSDDLDLFNAVEGNILRYALYQPTSTMIDNLYDLFYYYGYSHPVQELPDFTSRVWFNFVQCKPDWQTVTRDDVPLSKEYRDDMDNRFQIGVTNYHYHTDSGATSWDWGQDLENWETWIIY